MSKANESAFPIVRNFIQHGKTMTIKAFGLTKREYIATKAMEGIMAGNPADTWPFVSDKKITYAQWVAKNAVDLADALLVELEKSHE